MPQLATFIGASHRPEISGGRLDTDHESKFILDYSMTEACDELKVNALVFGPKKDNVLLNLEYAIEACDRVLVLYYEDIHQRWSYVQTNTECYFLYKKNEEEQYKIRPNCVYVRGCQIDTADPYWLLIGEFYNFVDAWNGKVVCSPKAQSNNESKLYQLTHSLRASSKEKRSISLGTSHVIKGKKARKQLKKNQSYIVKSLSSIRSIVVDEHEFNRWDQSNLNNLPVLFQEKIEGHDLRVHVVNSGLYGKISFEKEQVDYRYDKQFWFLKDFHDFSEELQQFCIDVGLYEGNPLIGLDFIKKDEHYVVLEANPSPGWSAYHQCNGMEHDVFIKELITELKSV